MIRFNELLCLTVILIKVLSIFCDVDCLDLEDGESKLLRNFSNYLCTNRHGVAFQKT